MGYIASKNDYSLLYKKHETSVVYLAIYVDEILNVGNDDVEITHIKSFLNFTFKIKDLGTPHYFLGLEFQSVPAGVFCLNKNSLQIYYLSSIVNISHQLVVHLI